MSALSWALIMSLAAKPECSVEGMVPSFWPAVVSQESGSDPLAIRDDTVQRSIYPASPAEAVQTAQTLLATGHMVGVGLSQLTANSEAAFTSKFGITIAQAFDACQSMHTGAQFFVAGALQTYNSGRPTGAPGYATAVQAKIGIPHKDLPQAVQSYDPPASSIVAQPSNGGEIAVTP